MSGPAHRREFARGCSAGPLILICLLSTAPARGLAGDDTAPQVSMTEPLEIAFYDKAPIRQVKVMRKTARELCASAGNHPTRSYGPTIPAEKLDWLCDGTPLRFLTGVQINGVRVDSGYICDANNSAGMKYNTPRLMQTEGHCVSFYMSTQTDHFEISLE